jgi:DNA-binding IclR family transcriptional regulator
MAGDAGDDAASGIKRRDEVLELLYWTEGEGFSGASTLEAITRFLTYERATVLRTLEDLTTRGDVVHDPATGEYRLTEIGRKEAARRFAEEFAPMLNQGHGECNDPNCDCHSDPKAAAECHAARHSHD